MNQLEMFKKDIYVSIDDHSNQIYQTCLSIPSSAGITKAEMVTVIKTIKAFYALL
jgi:dTDP-4-amino-4,6-dideoxygalactose transaminase